MSSAILVLAPEGFGKSTSIGRLTKEDLKSEEDMIGLDPSETILVNVKGKPLPFRGWAKQYKGPISAGGNYIATTDYKAIIDIMKHIDEARPEIHNFVIDDSQYLMAEEFMANALKTGYEKFSKMAKNMYDVTNRGIAMRPDINFLMLGHSEKDGDSHKQKTIGKMLDEKVTLAGLFTIVLYGKTIPAAEGKKVQKVFVTNYDGEYPAKSPVGMFEDLYIPNDLGLVIKKVNEYYYGE